MGPDPPLARSVPTICTPDQTKAYPKSMSVVDMLKLGKVIDEKTTTAIDLFTFSLDLMAWSRLPVTVDFSIEKKPLGTGGFREAYKATSLQSGYDKTIWVVKKYLPDAVQDIVKSKLTPEQHTKKVVQMHMLAKNFACQLKQQLEKNEVLELYGQTFTYNDIFLGVIQEAQEYVTIEEFVEGKFVKYLNNTGIPCGNVTQLQQKAESLTHFSFVKSNMEMMVVDIQGSGHQLFDPEIASRDVFAQDSNELLFTSGNLSEFAITKFISEHQCNEFCKILDLPELSESGDASAVGGED